MAPDKIVIFPFDFSQVWYTPDSWETVPSGNVEYIRKDKILKVLEDSKHLTDAALKIDEL